MTYENWINSCPDPVRFATNYVDIESDVLSVIDTYDREEWDKSKINEEFIKDICFKFTIKIGQNGMTLLLI